MENKRTKNRRVIAWAKKLLSLACLSAFSLFADEPGLEYKIKAGYLYNFTKFVTWPEIKGNTFNLCIIGSDPFGEVIDPIENKSAFDRPIKVIRLNDAATQANPLTKQICHIVYFENGNNLKILIEKTNAAQNKAGVLVVGEGEAFTAGGGMIGFVNRDGKIKLQINQQSVQKTGLKISAKLFEIAELINGGSND